MASLSPQLARQLALISSTHQLRMLSCSATGLTSTEEVDCQCLCQYASRQHDVSQIEATDVLNAGRDRYMVIGKSSDRGTPVSIPAQDLLRTTLVVDARPAVLPLLKRWVQDEMCVTLTTRDGFVGSVFAWRGELLCVVPALGLQCHSLHSALPYVASFSVFV